MPAGLRKLVVSCRHTDARSAERYGRHHSTSKEGVIALERQLL